MGKVSSADIMGIQTLLEQGLEATEIVVAYQLEARCSELRE